LLAPYSSLRDKDLQESKDPHCAPLQGQEAAPLLAGVPLPGQRTKRFRTTHVVLAAAGKEAEWLRNLIHKIPIWPKPIAPISIRCDSALTTARAYSQIYNEKSRHLGVRHSMVGELIRNGVISIEFVQTQHKLVDHLTKGLARDLVQDLKRPPM
nr:zinc finger, CCHC-type [Tanacetum cinerariifolium]